MHSTKNLILAAILWVTVVLLLACAVGQCYNYYILQHLKAKTPGIETWYKPLRDEFFAQLLFCIATWIAAYMIHKHTGKFKLAGVILSIFGTITFCGFVMQGICMNEFYEEFYLGGYNADFEWSFTHVILVIDLLFCACVLGFMILGFRNLKIAEGNDSKSSEYIFEVTQYIGVMSGLIGILFSYYAFQYLSYYSHKLSPGYVNWIFMCCLIFIFPYLSMILFWIIKLAFKKNRSLYDEKQKKDLANSGLFTWLMSIPLMSLFMFINLGHARLASGLIAFPVYVFTTLLIFSVSVLFNFKRA